MGFADGEKWMTGHMYIFHNTLFRSDEWLPTGGLGGNRIVKHTVSRNNILHVRSPQDRSASEAKQNVDNDFDYDLYNGRIPRARRCTGCAASQSTPPAPASTRRQRPAVSRWPRKALRKTLGLPITNFTGPIALPSSSYWCYYLLRITDARWRQSESIVSGRSKRRRSHARGHQISRMRLNSLCWQ